MDTPAIRGPFLLKRMVLPKVELLSSLFFYIYLFIFVCGDAFEASHRPNFKKAALAPKDLLGIQSDNSYPFWRFHKNILRKAWPYLMLYFLLSKILRQYFSSLRWSLICGFCSLIFALQIFGWRVLAVLLMNIVLYAATAIMFRNRPLIWALFFVFKMATMSDYYQRAISTIVPKNIFWERSILTAISCTNLRCLIFFDDALRLMVTKPLLGKHNLCTFLHFLFYPPTFLFGQIVTYRTYVKMLLYPVHSSPTSLALRTVRLICAGILLHVSFYIFYPTFLANPHLVAKADHVALIGCLYLNAMGFYLTYLQKYGLSWILRRLDGLDMPEWPACVTHIFSSVEMGRVFDRDAYSFLKDYIYIPLGGNRSGFGTRLFASLACFAFSMLHCGALTEGVVIWFVVSFALYYIEVGAVKLYYSDMARPLTSALSPTWTRRIVAFLGSWMLLTSFFAFACFDLGGAACRELFWILNNRQSACICLFGSYSLVQLAIECRVRGWYDPTVKKMNFKTDKAKV